jgi:OTU domain-containing protein 6
LCATILEENESEFAPFCELNDNVSSYKEYVGAVRSSHDWGGHLELRALSMALRRPFHVYSIQSTNGEPLVIDSSLEASEAVAVEPIRLSYHLHYYALGEHYNSVVRRAQRENDE